MRYPSLALCAFLLLAGCTESPIAPRPSPEEPLRISASREIIFETREPFSPSPFVTCTGEIVDLDGYQDVSVWQNTSASGRTTFRLKVVVHLAGTGRVSGDSYLSNEVTGLTGHYDGPSTAESFMTRVIWVAKGKAPNTVGWIRSHITINANGQVTVDRIEFSGDDNEFFECRGSA